MYTRDDAFGSFGVHGHDFGNQIFASLFFHNVLYLVIDPYTQDTGNIVH